MVCNCINFNFLSNTLPQCKKNGWKEHELSRNNPLIRLPIDNFEKEVKMNRKSLE